MDEDGMVLDWVRFYGFLIVALIVLGATGGAAYNRLMPGGFEATSLVLETSGRISPHRLGPVAEAVFTTEAVYGPAIRELGLERAPERFLTETADLRPVPDSNALIVVGRADSLEEAKAISAAMARSLVAAFAARAERTSFVVFGAPQAASVPEGVPPVLAVVLGGTIGFWVAVALALFHFWRVRPVLRVERALAVTGADLVTVLDGRRRWLGVLRRRPSMKNSPSNLRRLELAGVGPPDPQALRLVSPTAPADAAQTAPQRRGRRRAGQPPLGPDDSGVIVSHPGIGEARLAEVSRFEVASEDRPALVWVR